MSFAADASRQIGSHRHQDGSIHSGLDAYGGCDICVLALDWLDELHAHGVADVWHDPDVMTLVRAELKRRSLVAQGPPAKTYVDPHKPQELEEEEKPSLDKIKTTKTKKVVEVEASPQVEMMMQTLITASADNESSDDVQVEPPKQEVPVFKLTNPDEFTIKKNRRRKR